MQKWFVFLSHGSVWRAVEDKAQIPADITSYFHESAPSGRLAINKAKTLHRLRKINAAKMGGLPANTLNQTAVLQACA